MAKLILSMDGLVLKEIPLSKERTTIGRKAHNDIQIDNLAVSGEHAVIVTILNDSFMEDLGSTNGTLVNGNPVKKHFLQNNAQDLGRAGNQWRPLVARHLAQGLGGGVDVDFVIDRQRPRQPGIGSQVVGQAPETLVQPRQKLDGGVGFSQRALVRHQHRYPGANQVTRDIRLQIREAEHEIWLERENSVHMCCRERRYPGLLAGFGRPNGVAAHTTT